MPQFEIHGGDSARTAAFSSGQLSWQIEPMRGAAKATLPHGHLYTGQYAVVGKGEGSVVELITPAAGDI